MIVMRLGSPKYLLARALLWRSALRRFAPAAQTIRGRILCAFLAISLVTAALGTYAGIAIGRAAVLVSKTYDQSLMSINYARAASADFAAMQASYARRRLAGSASKKEKLDHTISELRRALNDDIAIAAERSQSPDAMNAAHSVRQAVKAWDDARRLLPATDLSDAQLLSLEPYEAVVAQQIDLLINYTAGDGFTYRQSALDAVNKSTKLAFAATAIALLLSALVTWFLARHIAAPLAAASAAAENIAAGRLQEPIPAGSGDELGSLLDSMRTMRDNIKMAMEREVALRRSAQSRLGDALESSPEGIVMIDADGRVELSNSQASNFFGTLDTLKWLELLHIKGSEEVGSDDVASILASGAKDATPGDMELQDGRHLRVNLSRTRDGGYIALFNDISLLKNQEAKLKTANHLLDAALENMSQGLCLYDSDKRLKVVNRRFCEIFGVPPAKLEEGIKFEQVIALSAEAGNHPDRRTSDLIAEEMEFAISEPNGSRFQELSGERVVAINRTALADGGWVSTFEDVTERRRAEAQIVFMARHDALTGLSNRILFGERIETAIAHIGRSNSGFSVLCLDLDHFKEINDTLGHPIGDCLLQCVAERLRSCVREFDTVGRLGGDEFAVLLANLDRIEDVEIVARRIVSVIGEPYMIDNQKVTVSVSIGIAIAPDDGKSYEDLLKNADVALYLAKKEGRGTWRFFEAEMEVKLQARRAMELDLREAIDKKQFEVHYQPIFDLANRRIAAFEALVRWRHPVRGLISPGEFIPLAEEMGLIRELGDWVLTRACFEALTWPSHTKVAVNVSATQFKDDRFLDVVSAALMESGLVAERLELEVTESVLLSDTLNNLQTLQALRHLGICISMDDFGTGYSSLSYLGSFPFDKIKIDQSFVRSLSANDGHRAIIRAVVALGSSLGIRTVAEGVETYDQLGWLDAIGCSEVQGYYFSRPVPATEIPRLIRDWDGKQPVHEARQIGA